MLVYTTWQSVRHYCCLARQGSVSNGGIR